MARRRHSGGQGARWQLIGSGAVEQMRSTVTPFASNRMPAYPRPSVVRSEMSHCTKLRQILRNYVCTKKKSPSPTPTFYHTRRGIVKACGESAQFLAPYKWPSFPIWSASA